MSFTYLTWPFAMLGLVGLGAALYLLQRLRVRHEQVTVPTTMFWAEAIQEAQARVRTKSFRHWPAYFLSLALAWLLAAAALWPRSEAESVTQTVVLLDGSSVMMSGSRFPDTVAALTQRLETIDPDQRRVLLCAAETTPLLLPEEPLQLFQERVKGVQAVSAKSSVDQAVLALNSQLESTDDLRIVIAGDSKLSAEVREQLSPSIKVERLMGSSLRSRLKNRGVTAFGISEAESGVWGQVDAYFEIQGSDADNWSPIATLDGKPLVPTPWSKTPRVSSGRAVRAYVLRGLPAEGGTLLVGCNPTDPWPVDDRAIRVLPVRRPVEVAIDPAAPALIQRVLNADPAVAIVANASDAQVCIRQAGSAFGASLPALEFVGTESQEEAILFTAPGRGADDEGLMQRFRKLGIDENDATRLATRTGRVVSVGMKRGARRRIQIWSAFLDAEGGFVKSRSLPLFVAQSVRWLAAVEDYPVEVAVGEVVAGAEGIWRGDECSSFGVYPSGFLATRSGEYRNAQGANLGVALLDADLSAPTPDDLANAAIESGGSGGSIWNLVSILGTLALVLLGIEWWFYRTGRIP